MTRGEPSETDPFLTIPESSMESVLRDIKLSREAQGQIATILSESHPVLYRMTVEMGREISELYDPETGESFLSGAFAGYAVIATISRVTTIPLPVETSSGDIVHDIETNYPLSEVTREKLTAAENVLLNSPQLSLEGDLVGRLTVAREFSKKHPQYYELCLKFAARSLRRPISFFEDFLESGDPKTTPQIIGHNALKAELVEDENYQFLSFISGFTGMITLLMERRERDYFFRNFGFNPTGE